MKKVFFQLLIFSILLVACQDQEEYDPFLITKTHVGPLTKNSEVRQLDSIFDEGSIVTREEKGMFGNGDEIIVYDHVGTKLLLLNPVQSFDSTSTIGNIQILDPRFKTRTGFGLGSTFKDIVANYNISRIENTLNAIVVFIDEINAYVTIEKEELPPQLRGTADQHIQVDQIPEDADINYFWIGWQ